MKFISNNNEVEIEKIENKARNEILKQIGMSMMSKKAPKNNQKQVSENLNAIKNIKIGVVTSRFNQEITDKLEEGALDVLEEAQIEIYAVRVPGAVEIPLACRELLLAGCDGVVALGAVIRGETTHYDYVCNSVERGITQLMLEMGKPIGFGVLTTENEEQAYDRVGGKHGHKGMDAALVTLEMVGLLPELRKIKFLDEEILSSLELKKTSSSKKGKNKTQRKHRAQ